MKANGVTLIAHSRQQESLHRLLDSVEKTHRDDIDTYSKGHLNEGKLYKLQTASGPTHKPWKSSSSKANPVLAQPAGADRRAYSTESYLSDRDIAPGGVTDTARNAFPLSSFNQVRPAWAASIENDSVTEAQSLGALKDKNLQAFQRSQPLQPGNGAITRKDHLRQMKVIDRKVIGRSDQHERRAMSGMKAVEHLEKKLREGLHQLPAGNFSKPNFNRLQVFSGVFDDLIFNSNTLTFILKTVKQEYDNYLTYLLDGHLTRQRTLCDQVEDISRNGDAVSAAMEDAMRTVDNLEDSARKELQLNERLRQQLGEEAELLNRLLTAEKVPKAPLARAQPEVADTSDALSSRRLSILDKMDSITMLKNQLRNEFVPISICSDLEQCVRDTEIEIQTLMSQKDYFEKSITDLEGELKRTIEAADTTERDAKRIWKKIQALTMSSCKAQSMTGNTGSRILGPRNEDSDEEESESEHKWSWYIS